MLAADAGAAVCDGVPSIAEVSGEVCGGPFEINRPESCERRQVVFLDERVPDLAIWSAGVSPRAELVLIGSDEDPIERISRTLTGDNIQSVHIISHGDEGELQIGNQTLDASSLRQNRDQIEAWKHSLADHADILLYGCDVAAGEKGEAFVSLLADLTGADVAASTNSTGGDIDGGDWVLESHWGSIETPLVYDASVRKQLRGTLNIVVNAWGQTGQEQFELQIDGETVATYNADTAWTPFEFETDQALTGDRVRIQFINDLYDPANGIDRNLTVSNIQINGVNYETGSIDTFSTGTWTSEDGIQDGFARGITLHANGYFQYGEPPQSGTTLRVRAQGAEGSEQFRVVHQGDTVATFTAFSQSRDYEVTVAGDVSASDVRIEFINDLFLPDQGFDRNLTVDSLTINETVFETEDPSTFASGVFVEGQGITSGFLQTETLNANGFFQFGDETPTPTGVLDTSYGGDGITPVGRFVNVSAIDESGNTLILDSRSLRLLDRYGFYLNRFGDDGIVDLSELIPGRDVDTSEVVRQVADAGDGGWIVNIAEINSQGDYEPLVFKVTSSGDLDTSFGTNGFVQNTGLQIDSMGTFIGPLFTRVYDPIRADVDSQGRILLAGELQGSTDRAVVRLDSNGQFDTSFGNDSTATLTWPSGNSFGVQDNVRVLDDGSILAITRAGAASIWKLTESGSLDASYGTAGVAVTGSPIVATQVDQLGRVLAGSSTQVARYDANGGLDSSFGVDGVFRTTQDFDIGLERVGRFRGTDPLNAILVDEDNRVILSTLQRTQTGRNSFDVHGTMYLVLNESGQLDSSFSDDGAAGTEFAPTRATVYDGAGGIVAIGITEGGQFGQAFQYRFLV